MTIVWANVLFLGAIAVGASVIAAALVLVIEKYREDRRLTKELAEYDDERPPLPVRIPKQRKPDDGA